MDLLAVFSAVIIILAFLVVFTNRYEATKVFAVAFVVLLVSKALPAERAFLALANPGVITLICLFAIAGSLRTTGAMQSLLQRILISQESSLKINKILLPSVAGLSAFFSNTPIVAALTPSLVEWCKRVEVSPSRILLPLSYAAILGGTCTLIGTSTTLVVYGLLLMKFPSVEFGFFEIAKIGLPITLLGLFYLIFFSKYLLPKRESIVECFSDVRLYTFEMEVAANGELVGKTVKQAGLRGLENVYLIEINRSAIKIGNVGPDFVLQANDRLVFSGGVPSLSNLVQLPGLMHVENQLYKLENTIDTQIVEAIVGTDNIGIGKTIKELGFRKKFQSQYTNQFLILQGGVGITPQRKKKANFAWLSLISVVFLAAFGILDIVVAASLGVFISLASGSINIQEAIQNIDLKVIAIIVFAFGFGETIQATGLAESLSYLISDLHVYGPFVILLAVYLLTMLLTELITNNAAAIIAFAIVSNLVPGLQLNIIPYVVAIMIAASASFITPFGYQTNLIVFSAGNYRYFDYLRLGLPLSIAVMVLSLILIPLNWNLTL